MKVLVTGGYGFIGSHVAERFFREGFEVFIIDNMSRGKKENISFKHKSYQMSVEDERCREIFRSNKFDVVVHMAAQISVTSSISDPKTDTESNVTGLVNMLDLSRQYNVSKFIFASSAAVYGPQTSFPTAEDAPCSPVSPYGISKLTGESYCLKWEELYGLQTVGFRFSNVYGPRQDSLGEGGVISIFMGRVMAGQPLVVYGDGNQTRDFIYVEDVADAIFRASNSHITGMYNLSTCTENSVNDLIRTLEEIHSPAVVAYEEKRSGDIEKSVLDNSRIKRDLDWTPMYQLKEGLQRTAAYFQKKQVELQSAATIAVNPSSGLSKAKGASRKYMPYIENLFAFALTAWLTLSQLHSSYGVIDVKFFYITIMGIMYGNRQAILSVMLSIGLFVYHKMLDGRELISLMYDTDFFFQIAIYLFIGLVVGYTIERKNELIGNQEQKIDELDNRYEFLNGVYNEVREVKDELQLRILNAGDSYGKIYSVTKELESLEPEQVFTATVNVVKSIMNAPSVAIYTVNRNQTYIRLLAGSNSSGVDMPKSLKVEEHAYLTGLLGGGDIHLNKELSESSPLMCAPVKYKDEIAAVIMIDGLPFDNFSLYHQNLFRITVDLVSSALAKAFAYIEATEHQRYVEGTALMRSEAFRGIVESKELAKEQHNVPYLLLKGNVDPAGIIESGNNVAAMLRETDYIGLDQDGSLLVLLSNTGAEDATFVLERLSPSNVSFTVVEEER